MDNDIHVPHDTGQAGTEMAHSAAFNNQRDNIGCIQCLDDALVFAAQTDVVEPVKVEQPLEAGRILMEIQFRMVFLEVGKQQGFMATLDLNVPDCQ